MAETKNVSYVGVHVMSVIKTALSLKRVEGLENHTIIEYLVFK